jgi:transcriptional regulator with XRE-family HTH domain
MLIAWAFRAGLSRSGRIGTQEQRYVPSSTMGGNQAMVPRKDNEPHPIDVYVGGRMRLRRIQLGLSQGALASKIGVSFQAVQKYESGDIRISASRLYDVAQVLQVSPAFFFEGYPDGMVAKNLAQEIAPEVNETFDRREIMSLIRGYYGIRDPQLQADILRLIAKLGNREAELAQ